MTVKHMRIFIAVYQARHITKAAEILCLTQPAVTRAIQEIERYYGVQLFERVNHRLNVTEAGKALYPQALHIVDSFDQLEKGLYNWDSFGVMRIGASVTIGNCLLPELILNFKARYPHLSVRYMVLNGGALQEALADGKLDVALVESDAINDGLISRPFYHDDMALIAPLGHPLLDKEALCLADLAPYDLLMREEGSAGRAFIENIFAVNSIPFRPTMTSISTQAIIQAVRYGLGISILPRRLVAGELAAGNIATRAILGVDLSRRYNIVWHRNKFLSPALKAFIEICAALEKE